MAAESRLGGRGPSVRQCCSHSLLYSLIPSPTSRGLRLVTVATPQKIPRPKGAITSSHAAHTAHHWKRSYLIEPTPR